MILALLGLLGCRPDPTLAPFSSPLWFEPDLTGALDLGHIPSLQPLASGPLRFEDATEALGLGQAIAGGNQHGIALAAVDLDGDGRPEVFVANGIGNVITLEVGSSLWHNQSGGFVDITESSGLGGLLAGADLYSVAAGDLDDDGDIDLYLGAQPTNILLENLGDLQFRDATADLGAAGPPSDASLVGDGRSKLVAIGDANGDGALDLVSASSTLPAPGAFLLLREGSGFVDATESYGLSIHDQGNPCALQFTDYDNDGLVDLWIWNDRGGHLLFHHTGEGWENLGSSADRTDIRNPMGIDGADIDRDGDLDYYVSNIGPHPLLINNGDGTFTNDTLARGTEGEYGWGLGFEDFDRDGWVDLFVTQEDERPWLSYQNLGDGFFESAGWDHAPIANDRQAHNTPAVFADLDGDGRIDVLGANSDGSRLTVLRNVTPPAGHWLDVEVTSSTGQAGSVGARVVVSVDGELMFRDLTGGSSRGSQSPLSARFGLGPWDGADWVAVLWTDGRQVVRIHVPGDQRLTP